VCPETRISAVLFFCICLRILGASPDWRRFADLRSLAEDVGSRLTRWGNWWTAMPLPRTRGRLRLSSVGRTRRCALSPTWNRLALSATLISWHSSTFLRTLRQNRRHLEPATHELNLGLLVSARRLPPVGLPIPTPHIPHLGVAEYHGGHPLATLGVL
jgi:hypothetical protein